MLVRADEMVTLLADIRELITLSVGAIHCMDAATASVVFGYMLLKIHVIDSTPGAIK